MLVTLVVFAWAILILAVLVLGAVLACRLWLARMTQWNRILTAAFVGPLTMFLPAALVSLLDNSGGGEALLVLGLGSVLIGLIVGLPTAIFATRRLDRMIGTDLTQTFD